MSLWRWLTTPDPNPGFTTGKMLKLLVRVTLFAIVATLLSALLSLTPLKQYLQTGWGSLIFILLLYIPVARFMTMDSFTPSRPAAPGSKAVSSSAQRRKEKNRFAGVKKSPPKYGGGRR